MSIASTPTESSVGYSAEEIAEMKKIFAEYDKDGSGHLNAHEFTHALQLMDYKYNESFVIEVLKLVFDDQWEIKKDNLLFEDFMDFMSEFEPVHYQVIDKIDEKLKHKNINNINIDDPRITNLLKYAQMKNGSLLLNEIDHHLNELKINNNTNEITNKLPLKSPLPSIIENKDIQNAENNLNVNNNNENSKQIEEKQPNLAEIMQKSDDKSSISNMSNNELIELLNMDKTFNTTMIRRECCDIIQTQQWNGKDIIEALKLNKMDEILLLFKNIQNYEYIIQSLKKLNPSDINYNELIENLEIYKNESISHNLSQDLHSEELDTIEATQSQMELKPSSPPKPPLLNVGRTISMTNQTIIDNDDEIYTQNVWKQILKLFDENNDGTIDIKEMAPALRSLGIDVNDNKLNDMISKMDNDDSRTIDYIEFKTYYHTLFKNKLKQGLDWTYIQNIFDKYDTDSSGFLDIYEFTFALKKICKYINDDDIKSILHLIDVSGDHKIEFEEFVNFLESDHPKAEWVLKKLIRSSIPTPMEYLIAFKGLPQHFRSSELSELANHNSFKISERLKPEIDIDGITLKNIKIDPKTCEIHRKYIQTSSNDESDCKQTDEEYYLQNMRVFKITECEGVPLPESNIASHIISRRVRICLYSNNKPISNVFTIPASWKETEEDQWQFGGSNVWKDSMSNTVSEWNIFCVSIPHNITEKIELYIELCITIKAHATQQSESEMLCGWSKLEIHNTNINISNGINRNYKLKIYGGTFNNESNVENTDIRNDTNKSFSFRKLKQTLTSIQSIIKIQEQSYNNLNNRNKQYIKWIPKNVITTVSSCKIIKLYYELMSDCWFRNKQIFNFQFYKQNLYQILLLFIIDRPNLLCILIDEWKLKLDSLWRTQKNNQTFIKQEFKILLKQFIPLLLHKTLIENELTSLNQQRLSFIKQIVKGNVQHILNGNKPTSSIPLTYAPFTTDLFVVS